MKKIYLLTLAFILAVATITPAYVMTSTAESKPQPTTEEIVIRDVRYPPVTRPRSVAPIINAYYSGDMSMLEIYFNYYVGTVKISILDGMQQCVAQYTCNTEIEGEVFLNLSLSPEEEYTIHIVGNEYEGVGYF